MQHIRICFCLFLVYSSQFAFSLQRSQLPDHLAQNDVTHCRIPLKDLIATAEATSTRVLQGVCNPRELNERFTTLENQIVEQFNVLKTMVLNLEDKLRDQDEKVKSQHRKIHRTLTAFKNLRKNIGEKETESTVKKKSGTSSSTDVNENLVYEYNYDEEGQDDTLSDDEFKEETPSPRLAEIDRYNSTIYIEDGKRMFTYYWTIKDLPYRTKNWGWRRSLRSESFYISQYGYRMYMRIYPNQNGRNIYIHVGITKGDFDAALDWPFKLKHRIQVLDNALPGQDLVSRIWDPTQLCSGWNWRRPDSSVDNYECVGLGFSHETVHSRYYLHNNSLTVKLTVFLD